MPKQENFSYLLVCECRTIYVRGAIEVRHLINRVNLYRQNKALRMKDESVE
jgi:hypothetical protein